MAVAANFVAVAERIGVAFRGETEHSVTFSAGSTGQLFAQIAQEAPFDVYLAADQARPTRAVREGFAVSGSQFTYATGRIALYTETPGRELSPQSLLTDPRMRLAIANPKTAPYGQAAVQFLQSHEIYSALKNRLVLGNNIAQTMQFVVTGNADIGVVAVAQIAQHARGSRWLIPVDSHQPIAQDAVLLRRGERNEAARSFLLFLKGKEATAIKHEFGFSGD